MSIRFLFLLLILSNIVSSQENKQPKIGLVLSGGGAKGLAHVGVLKEIDKAGIQIDYIGGTSMGAIVGGLYATGYTAEQIEKLIIEANFNELLQDKTPRKDIPLFDKDHQEKYALTLPIRKGNIGLPKAISGGQNVQNFFAELFAPVHNVTDFSKLPIPFFCIATDIETGEKVILEKGSLASSVRASGAFPSLLEPVEINGRLLVDGGIANNFPADEIKKRGADIIIGLDVQNKLAGKEKLSSVVSILNQIIGFQIYEKSESQKKIIDVYIHPNVKEHSVISFGASKEIIEAGYKEAKKYTQVFDSIAKLQTIKKTIKKIAPSNKKFLIDRIIINGNKNYTEDYILGTLRLKKGDMVNYKMITEKINRLTATKNFKDISYQIDESFSGKKITLKVKENEVRSFLRLGLHYDLLYKSGILVNFTQKKLITVNDIFSLDVVFGDNIRYNLNYLIDNGLHWGLGLHSHFNTFKTELDFSNQSVNKLNINYRNFVNGLYIQTKFNKQYALSIGADIKNIKVFSETILIDGKPITFENTNYGAAVANLKIDTFDKPYYPTKGFYFNTDFEWFLISDRNKKRDKFISKKVFKPFSQVKGSFSGVHSFGKKISLQYTFEAGFTFGNKPMDVFAFRLGGYNKNYQNNFSRFYGYDVAELIDIAFVKGEAEFRYQFYPKHYGILDTNIGRISNENIFKKGSLLRDIKSGYAIGYGLETFLGPIELKYSWSPEKRDSFWYFNLGFWF